MSSDFFLLPDYVYTTIFNYYRIKIIAPSNKAEAVFNYVYFKYLT